MGRGKELKILPSVTGDGSEVERELKRLPKKEKEELIEQICRKISRNISDYYSLHEEEWEEFLKAICRKEDRI